HAFPVPGEFTSSLYSDAGDGYGPNRLDQYTLKLSGDRLDVHCETQGDYQESFKKLCFVLHRIAVQPGEILEALVDGVPCAVEHDLIECAPFKDLSLRFSYAG
ncbi:MAG TPA: hypothetical protein VF823_03910, partial [Anaerolineales bacterium]